MSLPKEKVFGGIQLPANHRTCVHGLIALSGPDSDLVLVKEKNEKKVES